MSIGSEHLGEGLKARGPGLSEGVLIGCPHADLLPKLRMFRHLWEETYCECLIRVPIVLASVRTDFCLAIFLKRE